MSEPAHGATGPGAVVLDLGGETGALVLHAPPGLAGAEIEISRNGTGPERPARTHARVRERRSARTRRYAAVYPGLAAGVYTVWAPDGSPAAAVTVTGGRITHHHL